MVPERLGDPVPRDGVTSGPELDAVPLGDAVCCDGVSGRDTDPLPLSVREGSLRLSVALLVFVASLHTPPSQYPE